MLLCFCRKQAQLPGNDQDYFPAEQGNYRIYEVDSTVYNEIPRDTFYFKYLVKEVFAEQFTDDQGKKVWRLERFIKKHHPAANYDSMPWQIKDVWVADTDARRVQVVEENQRFTKLIFPVVVGEQWDGNAANGTGKQLYSYKYKDRAETLGHLNFDKVLLVKQKDLVTLISVEVAEEKYARGVGMVWSSYTMLYSNNIIPQIPVKDRIEHGVTCTRKLISYGKQ